MLSNRINLISEHLLAQVNKIREVPGYESILVTHTDAPELYVWSLERQPDRAQDRVCDRKAAAC